MKRPLLFMAVCFVCGILWQGAAGSGVFAFLIPGLLLFGILVFCHPRSGHRMNICIPLPVRIFPAGAGRRYICVFCAVSVILFYAAMILSAFSQQRREELGSFAGEKEARVTGRIEDIRGAGDTVKLTLDECRLHTDKTDTHLDFRSIVFLSRDNSRIDPSGLHTGNVISVTGQITPFKNATNPGGFDSFEYYAARGIGAGIYPQDIEVVSDDVSFASELVRQVLDSYTETVSELFDADDASQLIALTVGDKSLMDEEIYDMYKKNGMMHIMAISGLHISLAGLSTYRLLKKLRLSWKISAAAGFALALFYCALTGFSPSAYRALLMMCVLLLGEVLGKCYDSLSALSLSLIVLLAANPAYIRDGGFLLSFGAAFGIAVWMPVLGRKHDEGRASETGPVGPAGRSCGFGGIASGCAGVLRNLLAPTVSVYLMILPVIINLYYEFPLYSVFVNLVAAPLMPVLLLSVFAVVSLSALSKAFGGVWFLDGVCLFLVGLPHYILALYGSVCSAAEALPFHTVITGAQAVWKIALYYAGQLLLAINLKGRRVGAGRRPRGMRAGESIGSQRIRTGEKGRPQGIRRGIASAAFALAAALVLIPGRRADAGAVFLDVGQGDGICIEAGNTVFMVDGGSTSLKKLEKNVLAPFFKHEAAAVVDCWFLSHADRDHTSGICDALDRLISRGYKKEVTEEFCISDYRGDLLINRIILPCSDEGFETVKEKAASVGIGVINLSPGDRVRSGGLDMICEAPSVPLHSASSNETSLILSVIKDGEGLILLTGDVGGDAELELAHRIRSEHRTYRVLKVAHHGSRYSNSEELLSAVAGAGEGFDAGPASASSDNVHADPSTGLEVDPSDTQRIAVISAAVNNRYRHPHGETVERLLAAGFEIKQVGISGAFRIIFD